MQWIITRLKSLHAVSTPRHHPQHVTPCVARRLWFQGCICWDEQEGQAPATFPSAAVQVSSYSGSLSHISVRPSLARTVTDSCRWLYQQLVTVHFRHLCGKVGWRRTRLTGLSEGGWKQALSKQVKCFYQKSSLFECTRGTCAPPVRETTRDLIQLLYQASSPHSLRSSPVSLPGMRGASWG